ncbi:MAG: AAA family ATPase [Bacteroidota bacterium]|nr:AAA family ATPase [Bacteroidota bacterium]
MYFLLGYLVVRLLVELIPLLGDALFWIWDRVKFRRVDTPSDNLFDNSYVDGKALYMRLFNRIPNIHYMDGIDSNLVMECVQTGKFGRSLSVYQRTWFNRETKALQSARVIFRLEGNILLEIGEHYLELLFDDAGRARAKTMVETFKGMEVKAKEKDFEICVINLSAHGLELKTLPVQPVSLDIDLYYNDDFKEVDATIRERLTRQNDKGIILLHGLPGTGKTTYLRHLIGTLQKRVMFVSPAVAANLTNPEFISLLIDNPNSVLIIEDSENIIMDRRYSQGPGVSNLLNISDGLLSDCLNVQVICTFNSALSTVDSALLRKGRLIARYEFGALSIQKATALSQFLGHERAYSQPATLAEIMNPGTKSDWVPPVRVIGFRPAALEN